MVGGGCVIYLGWFFLLSWRFEGAPNKVSFFFQYFFVSLFFYFDFSTTGERMGKEMKSKKEINRKDTFILFSLLSIIKIIITSILNIKK